MKLKSRTRITDITKNVIKQNIESNLLLLKKETKKLSRYYVCYAGDAVVSPPMFQHAN